jgi:hypothetical protein
MSELDFALDGLYAAGWWPSESDQCLQSTDQRWYPTPDTIRNAFTHQGIELVDRSNGRNRLITLSWEIPGHGSETVTAQTEPAACLLAYTHLYQASKREDHAGISR